MALNLEQLQSRTEIQAALRTLQERENCLYAHPRDLLCNRCWESYHPPVKDGYIWPNFGFSTTLNDLEVGAETCNLCGLLYVTALVFSIQEYAHGSELSRTTAFRVAGLRTGFDIRTLWGEVEMQRLHNFEFEMFADAGASECQRSIDTKKRFT